MSCLLEAQAFRDEESVDFYWKGHFKMDCETYLGQIITYLFCKVEWEMHCTFFLLLEQIYCTHMHLIFNFLFYSKILLYASIKEYYIFHYCII